MVPYALTPHIGLKEKKPGLLSHVYSTRLPCPTGQHSSGFQHKQQVFMVVCLNTLCDHSLQRDRSRMELFLKCLAQTPKT